MRREVLEETGLDLGSLRHKTLWVLRMKKYTVFVLRLQQAPSAIEPIDSAEIVEAQWVDMKVALHLNLNGVTSDVIRRYLSRVVVSNRGHWGFVNRREDNPFSSRFCYDVPEHQVDSVPK